MAESIDVVKAEHIRDLTDGELGIFEKLLCSVYTEFVPVSHGRDAEVLFKKSRELAFTDMAKGTELFDVKVFSVVFIEIFNSGSYFCRTFRHRSVFFRTRGKE